MKRIKAKSGLDGWQCRLQKNYASFGEFSNYSDMYGIAAKLGFNDAQAAWDANPLVQGSTNPDDYCLVHEGGGKRTVKVIVEIDVIPLYVGDLADWGYKQAAEDAVDHALSHCQQHGFEVTGFGFDDVRIEAAENEVTPT